MNDQIASIAKQRGKVVVLLIVLGFVLCLVNPETTGAVWPPVALAAGALAGMEAWAAKTGGAP